MLNAATPKHILVAPLNWGLGHATRCIPLIRYLLGKKIRLTLAGDGDALHLLQMEFPGLPFLILPSYNIRYSGAGSQLFTMGLQVPSILKTIQEEHDRVLQFCRQENTDLILSDNRYGVWSPGVKSVFITHQLGIRPPAGFGLLAPLIRSINFRFIRRFDTCWIPDMAGPENLSGELSHGFKTPFPTQFIGPLSRFSGNGNPGGNTVKNKLMIVLSGPEPQRSLLEKNMLQQLIRYKLPVLLVRGTRLGQPEMNQQGNVRIVNHLPSAEMEQAMMDSELIICRAGYSSIMDLAMLKKNAVLIPTPGQTEQEYLGLYLMQKGVFYSMPQRHFNLEEAIGRSSAFSGILSSCKMSYPSFLDEQIR